MSEIKPSAKLWNDRIKRKHEEKFAEDQRARHEKRMEQLRAGNKWMSDALDVLAKSRFDEEWMKLRDYEKKWGRSE